MRARHVGLTVLSAAVAVFVGVQPAHSAPTPVVNSFVEGNNPVGGGRVYVVFGKGLNVIKSLTMTNSAGVPVAGAGILLSSKSVLVIGLPTGLAPGDYTITVALKNGTAAGTFPVTFTGGAPAPGSLEASALSTTLRTDLDDAATVGGKAATFFADASNITAGTLDPARFSAYDDLVAETKIGPGAAQVAAGDHNHDGRYALATDLSTAGTFNASTNPMDWTKLKNVPVGTGLSLVGSALSVNFGGTGAATTVSRSDHDHDARYYTESELNAAGTINTSTNPVDWTRLKGVPSGFADGVDDTSSDWTVSGNDVFRASGRVGIGTSTPAATLHVAGNDGVLFTGSLFAGALAPTGAGTRMTWYPRKAAFRAGRVTANQWDDANIGTYSFATGLDTTASGERAFASGESTTASGDYSTSIGNASTASGTYSFATGRTTTASGRSSVAMGETSTATGDYAVAMGNGAVATGNSSLSIGLNTTALSYASVALGKNNVVAGSSTTSWVATDPLFVVGNGDTSPSNALTLLKNGDCTIAGKLTTSPGTSGVLFGGSLFTGTIPATGAGTRMMWYPGKAALRAGTVTANQWDTAMVGNYSAALGRNTTASGERAFAAGDGTTASGDYSVSLGSGTTASGLYSSAAGRNTTASGRSSVAIGDNGTTASGDYSIAMGDNAAATGNYALALGLNTTAQAYASVVLGRDNVVAGSTTTWVATDPLLVAGNGNAAGTPSNALTLLKNGNMTIAGTLTQNSDARLKTDITKLCGVLPKLMAIRGVAYRFKDEASGPEGRQIGLLAQEVREAFPELVHEDAQGKLSIAYGNLDAVLLEAVKEQQAVIEAKEREAAELRKELAATRAATEARIARLEALLEKSAPSKAGR